MRSCGDFVPTASFQFGYVGVTETPVMKTGNGSVQTAHRELYNWSVTLIQPLFTGFALSSRFKIAELDITVRHFEKKQIQNS